MTIRALIPYIVAIIAIELVGGAVGFTTSQSIESWYRGLEKPPLNPPDWSFGVVWPVLYAMIAVAGVMVWHVPNRRDGRAMMVYAAQLALNFGWTFVFFTGQWVAFALVWIAALLAFILWTIVLFFSIRRIAAWLLVPYALWVAFATYLNAGIWWLNG